MIKYLGLDVYGTILWEYDGDGSSPVREGLEVLFDSCKEHNIKVFTCSDVESDTVKRDLIIAFERMDWRNGLSIDRFFDHICLRPPGPKDYLIATTYFKIQPDELFIVDDRKENIQSALELGCDGILCPQYDLDHGKDWSFTSLIPRLSK